MKKDLRGRDALRHCPELASVAKSAGFDIVDIVDLRKLAELLRDYAGGSLDQITVDSATAFGGTSRHRFQCVQRALRELLGEEHPATCAVVAAALERSQKARSGDKRHRDNRPREAILLDTRWDSFRALPGTETIPMLQLRAVDRFLVFCEERGVPAGEVASFLAFVEDKDSSMLLCTLRDGLQEILTSAHPAVMAAETARSLKEASRYRRRKPKDGLPAPAPILEFSVPLNQLPQEWLQIFTTLRSGKRVRGRKQACKSVDNMATAARQLVWAARTAGLPDEISLDTVAAYDQALEAREIRATSGQFLFISLRSLGYFLGLENELLKDLQDLIGHYERASKSEVKVKERRLAELPDLQAIFDKSNTLLDKALVTTDRRSRTGLYVDAAALPFLSLIPLRNPDTLLRWGVEIIYIGDDDPEEWGLEDQEDQVRYYLDLRTSKTDSALCGPLAPILNPFLDALILRGQDERLLPMMQQQVMADQSPVFPKSNGQMRSVRSLSSRWSELLGTGSVISRTRIHTLLGALGADGTRAALALCAQRSPRTAKWYQAQSLTQRCMLESQDMTAGLIELSEEDEMLLASL